MLSELTLLASLVAPAPARPASVPPTAAAIVERMTGDAGCGARIPALVELGDAAAHAALAALPAAYGPSRWCLLETLRRLARRGPLPPSATGPLLWAFRAAASEEVAAFGALFQATSPSPAAEILAALEDDTLADERKVALANLLGRLPGDDARAATLASVGRFTTGPVRTALRHAAAANQPGDVLRAFLATAPGQSPARRADLLALLAGTLRRQSGDAQRVAAREAALHALWEPGAAFEMRARAVSVLGAVGDDDAVAALDDLRQTSPDAVLRDLACHELASIDAPAATEALRAALADRDPRVRATAAAALGARADRASLAALVAGAKQEPWPMVRKAELAALGRLCGDAAADLLIRAIGRDVEEAKHIALDGLVACRDARAVRVLRMVVLHDSASIDLRVRAANRLADLGDAAAVPDLAQALDRARAATDPGGGALALAIVDALARLCDPRATAALARAADTSDPRVAHRAAQARACAPAP